MVRIYIALSLLICSLGAVSCILQSKLSARIIGGSDADIERYPYTVDIEFVNSHRCSGAIISEEWLVTSATCIPVGPAYRLMIRAGSSIRGTGGSVHTQIYRLTHPNYGGSNLNYDIGLVSVDPLFNFSSSVQPISLADNTAEEGTSAVVTGWGAFDASEPNIYATNLQAEQVTTLNQIQCAEFTGGTTTICSTLSQNGPCGSGDTGDPLVADDILVGIVSIPSCGNQTAPNVYTDIASVRDFIRTHTGV